MNAIDIDSETREFRNAREFFLGRPTLGQRLVSILFAILRS